MGLGNLTYYWVINFIIFVMLFALSDSSMLGGMNSLVRMTRYFIQSWRICLTERGVWLKSHMGGGFLLIRKIWMLKECPILALVMATSCCLLKWWKEINLFVFFLIDLSSFVGRMKFQLFCHFTDIICLIDDTMS